MDWMLFWTAFGAIGGTIGAFATTAAVIVALWQTKYTNKKALKVEFSDNIRVGSCNSNPARWMEYVGITVTNIGNRNVKLMDWRFEFPDKKSGLILQDYLQIGKTLSEKWPMTLEPEDQTSQYWDKELFYAYVLDEAPKCSNRDMKKRITWIVKDSTGHMYKTMSHKTLQQYLNEANEWKKCK